MDTPCPPLIFHISDKRFGPIAESSIERLIDIGVKHKCTVSIQAQQAEKTYTIPCACSNEGNTASKPAAMSIDIRVGDLATQLVDMIIVSGPSDVLRNNLIRQAGTAVEKEYKSTLAAPDDGIETSGGQLLCQRIFFLPWEINKSNTPSLRQSIGKFVKTAVEHAVAAQQTSIAFPAIGCGGLNCDASLVAEEMLREAQKYASDRFKILFIILPDKLNLYQTFCAKLTQLRKVKPSLDKAEFTYPSTVLDVTVTAKTLEQMDRCRKAITAYVKKSVLTCECDEFPLYRWNQTTIDAFYQFCLERSVLPKIDTDSENLKLYGPRHYVLDAESKFYQIKSERSEESYIASIARHVVWVFSINNNKYEKYSAKLNARFEDAYQASMPVVKFKNHINELCRIEFKTMVEISERGSSPVLRNDFQMPTHWALQSDDVRRFVLDTTDVEYQRILSRFNETMQGKYTKIQIERIQNQRWHTGYECHKKFSKEKDSEQWLFHGCTETSAPYDYLFVF